MTKRIPRTQAPASPPALSRSAENRIGACVNLKDLHQALLDQAAAIYPCLNWLYGEITDTASLDEVEILAYSPTRLKEVYQGMLVPVLPSPFSQRLYGERQVSYAGEDQGTMSHLNPQFVETFALSSFMGVPLLFEGDILGLLFAATFKGETPAAPTGSQLGALRELARAGADALHRLRAKAAPHAAAGGLP